MLKAPELMDPGFRAMLGSELRSGEPPLRYADLATEVGSLWLAFGPQRLVLVSGHDEAGFVLRARARFGRLLVREHAPPRRLADVVLGALEGRRPADRAVDLAGLTPFQREVLAATAGIRRGEVRPYGWVAATIGRPAAVRAVGSALAANPVPFVIPCHRVVRADGELGEYSGGASGLKATLLAREGVDFAALRRGFRGNRNTRIFCFPTCYTHQRAKESSAVYFRSAEEAVAAGYRPCRQCRPTG